MDLRKVKDEAARAFSKGRFAKAAELYQQYCQGDPKDLQARLRMGDAFAKAGMKDKAISAYKAAAEGFARDGFLPRAIAASKLILELDPKHTATQQLLAGLYATKGGGPGTPKPAGRPSLEPRRPDAPAPATPAAGSGDWSTRSDAIELPDEGPGANAAASDASSDTGLELELDAPIKAPAAGTNEKAVAIDAGAGAVDLSDELPPELQLPSSAPSADEVGIELEVEDLSAAPSPGPHPPAAVATDAELLDVSEVEELDEPIALDRPKARAGPLDEAVPLPAPAAATPVSPGSATGGSAPAPVATFSPPGLKPKRAPAQDFAPVPLPSPQSATPVDLGAQRAATGAEAHEGPNVQFRPTGRIWIPGTAEPASTPPTPPAAAASSRGHTGGLADSLSRLSQFDELDLEAPVLADLRPAPVARLGAELRAAAAVQQAAAEEPRSPLAAVDPIVLSGSVGSFTELELDGDSLLHAVSMAAQAGAAERAQRGQASQADVESLRGGEEVTQVDADPAGGLPKIPLFSDLPPDAFIALFERCPLIRPANGERVIEQGSQGDSFFVICGGAVRVVREDDGARRELAVLKEGTFFGEMALLSGAARTASVESADDDTQLLEISGAILKELSAMYPQVAQALKKFMRQRLLSNVMGSSPLFAPFAKKERRALVERFRSREVKKGDAIIREGDRSDGLYIVLSGEVLVRKGSQELARLKEGDLFGEMSLLQKAPASATVSAAKNTTVLRLPRDDFDRLISTNPQVLTLVAELTANRAKANQALMKKAAVGEDLMV